MLLVLTRSATEAKERPSCVASLRLMRPRPDFTKPKSPIEQVASLRVTTKVNSLAEPHQCESYVIPTYDWGVILKIPCGGSSLLQAGWCDACGPVAPVVLLTLLEVEVLDTEPHPFGCVWIRVGLFVACGPSLTGD